VPAHGEIWAPNVVPWAYRVHIPNGISAGSAALARFMLTTNTQRDCSASVTIGSIICYTYYTVSTNPAKPISRRHPVYIFLNARRFLRDKPHNIKKQVKIVMSINEHVLMSSSS